jgi:hypothetical protein
MIFFEFLSSKYHREKKKRGGQLGWLAGGGQLGVANWGWLQSPFFIVCLYQGHFFLSYFSSISMIFSNVFLQTIKGKEEEWGGQLGVTSLGSLQCPFLIVCLNQGHFFLSLF